VNSDESKSLDYSGCSDLFVSCILHHKLCHERHGGNQGHIQIALPENKGDFCATCYDSFSTFVCQILACGHQQIPGVAALISSLDTFFAVYSFHHHPLLNIIFIKPIRSLVKLNMDGTVVIWAFARC